MRSPRCRFPVRGIRRTGMYYVRPARTGHALRLCAFGAVAAAALLLLAGIAYCQPEPEKEPGQDEKEETPLEVPQSPEEKKALQETPSKKQEDTGLFDEVVLKEDNTVIKGRVVDPGGPTIRVEQKLGWISILKSQIKELRLRTDPSFANLDEDVVYLSSGEEIRGRVGMSEDGSRVMVTTTKDGQKQAVAFPKSDILKIEWARERKARLKKRLEAFQDPLSAKIESALEELTSSEEAVWKAARERLVRLGVFAIDHLREKLGGLKEPAASRAKQVLKINEMKSYISPEVVESLKKDVYEKLVCAPKEEKLTMLRQLVLLEGDGAWALLVHMAKQEDESAEVRNFCLHNLAKADRNADLLRLMAGTEKSQGWLRLACALYLADNGVYMGVPHFISALKMRDPGARKTVAEKLRKASGKNFGFDPDGTEEERETAIKKWELWWKEHDAEIMRQSAKVLGSIDDDDRSFSRVFQKRGHASWDEGKPGDAVENFRKALELDPSNLSTRLSLAIILYTNMGKEKNKEARNELNLILKRYRTEASPMVRKLTFYHMALLNLTEGNWEGALHYLQTAIALDDKFADGYIAIGKTYYIQVVNDDMISRERLALLPESEREEGEQLRRQVVRRSVRALETGLALLDADIQKYTSMDFRKKRRQAERELEERLGAKAEGLTQAQWEISFKETLLAKKARVCAMLADSYALQLEWRKAAGCLGDAARLAPDRSDYLCRLGSALAAAGNRKEAREAFERCLKVDPKNEAAIQGLRDLK